MLIRWCVSPTTLSSYFLICVAVKKGLWDGRATPSHSLRSLVIWMTGAWEDMSVISAFNRQRQQIPRKVEASLVYTVSSWLEWATEWDLVSNGKWEEKNGKVKKREGSRHNVFCAFCKGYSCVIQILISLLPYLVSTWTWHCNARTRISCLKFV